MIALRGVDKETVARMAKAGDRAAEERLVEIHTPFIAKTAGRFLRRCRFLEFTDLLTAGQWGLLQALEKYDPNAGAKFLTYAGWWVRAAIGREINDNDLTIRVPVNVQDASYEIHKGTFKGTEAQRERVEYAARLRSPTSLDIPGGAKGDEEGKAPYETIADPEESIEAQLVREARIEAVRRVVKGMRLTRQERVILEARLKSDVATFQDIGDIFDLSRERIRQIEVRLVARLRQALAGE